jgi:L,D-transpeptidase ErfK/SrfK
LKNKKTRSPGAAVALMCFFIVSTLWATEPPGSSAHAADYPSHLQPSGQTLIGFPQEHVIQTKETLLDVARQYDLGFNEISDLYPRLNPWIPPRGTRLVIPSQWVLPEETIGDGILINVAELRLYYRDKNSNRIMTFPIGIGDKDAETPEGVYSIQSKTANPTWTIPPSLQYKYAVASMPPGPNNPLGDYWMGLGGSHYGIHGTDIPWSVGRLVTHGCIRMYPEDIAILFKAVPVGTRVKIIYEPVKIAWSMDRIFVEVHKDIYGRVGDLMSYGYALLHAKKIVQHVDPKKYRRALRLKNGMPVDVTRQ